MLAASVIESLARGVFILALACAIPALAAEDLDPAALETERLNAWLDARYEEELQLSPIRLSSLGRKARYGEIDDFSEAGTLAEYHLLEASVAELRRKFDYEKLSPEGRVSYDYWVYRLQIFKDSLPFLRHTYQFSNEGGAHTALPDFLINIHTVDTKQEMLDYIARIKAAARALGQSLQRAQQAAEEGIRPPRFAYETIIEVAGRAISGAPFTAGAVAASPLWEDANSKISSLQQREIIDDATAQRLRKKTSAALVDTLLPAYRNLIAWLQQDMPNSAAAARGASFLPDGSDYYAYCLAYYTTTDRTAGEIYELGLSEVSRIRKEIEELMTGLEFAGSLDEFFEFVRTDEQFYFSNDDAGRKAYLELTRHHIETMNDRLPDYFGTLPKGGMVVKRVESFRERDGMSAFYVEGTADGSRPGTYYLHLSDMTALNSTDIETTAYHEAAPGHHMQSAIAMEQDTLPSFRNDQWFSAYSEGWGLYAEYLASEMGAFADPYSDFGRLAAELLRAVRLVVDTGLHTRGWSEQQCVDYMLANTALPEVAVRSEIRRYLADPGQATSYTIGMLKIIQLRKQAQAVLGDLFDIRGFHDTVLNGGSLPLPILERRVNDWVGEQSEILLPQSPPAAG